MKRILTAALLIPVVAWVVLGADWWIFFAVLVTVACLCWHEYDEIAGAYGFGKPGVIGYGAGVALMAWNRELHWLPMVLFTLIVLVVVMRAQDLAHALPRAGLLVLGVIYVFGAWKCAIPLRESFGSRHWLMYGLLLNWVGDTGAYFVGRPFGKHKLAPLVSPKKSWEGSIASVFTSVIAGYFYLRYFLPAVPVAHGVAVTAIANIAGQLGDLAESTMKRGADVKDSGTILPGHGGFLDRVDSTLFALPVIYGYLLLVG
jgi:phosphatidate cytidylyltransferase